MAYDAIVNSGASPDSLKSGSTKLNTMLTELYGILDDDMQAALVGNGGTPDVDNTFVTETGLDTLISSAKRDAMAGTDGTPSSANAFVTDSDPRIPELADNIVIPVYSDFSWWTEAATLSMTPSYYGADGQIACYKRIIPFRFSLEKMALSVSAIGGSGATLGMMGIADMAGNVVASGQFTPSANDLTVTFSPAVTLEPGAYYVLFGQKAMYLAINPTYRRAFLVNYSNFKTGYTKPAFGIAANLLTGTDPDPMVIPETLGTVTTTGDDKYFPTILLIGENA